jgi:uncharacterized protein (TIGR00730 family)
MKRVCVFCGSSRGAGDDFASAAAAMGRALAERNLGLVYGGGCVGLMGILADAALARRGEVIGVIPEALVARELAHRGVTELRIVRSMHERKALMAELSDAFVALPGGLGTCEEFFEVLTWAQLGLHGKPCGLLNVGGYFGPLLAMLDHAVASGFLEPAQRAMVLVADTPDELLNTLARAVPRGPTTPWLAPDET